jgi:polyisoprenoid-binding protein YceI
MSIDAPVLLPGTYAIDADHSYVGFSVRHLMVARVKGRFTSVRGSVMLDDDPLASSVEVTIDVASVDTRNTDRDDHLRSPDFLDVEEHPTLTFSSTGVRDCAEGRFELDGVLTIKGVSRPITLEARVEGVGIDPDGNVVAGFSAHAQIDREDWGLTWNSALPTGGIAVGRAVDLEIEAEIVRT